MIRLEGITRSWKLPGGQTRAAVTDLNLEVFAGETLCLIGTSGSGKTTTLRLVNRLIEPTAGRLFVDERDVTDLTPEEVVSLRRGMGYVIQKGGLFPHLTVERNVGLLPRLERWETSRIARRVAELLQLVGLPPKEFAGRMPRELSGGEQQRVGVARALALDPPILLMDEPFGALDPITRRQMQGEFERLKREIRKTILLVTHDLVEAFRLGDRIALMDSGVIVQVGSAEDLLKRPATSFVESFVKGQIATVAT